MTIFSAQSFSACSLVNMFPVTAFREADLLQSLQGIYNVLPHSLFLTLPILVSWYRSLNAIS